MLKDQVELFNLCSELPLQSSPSESTTGDKALSSPMSSTVPEKLPAENKLVQSLFRASSSPSESSTGDKDMSSPAGSTVQMVKEILHGSFADSSDNIGTVDGDFKAKVRETMEKAFWDVVVDSMRGDAPDYSYLVNLVKEVRDALHEMAPKGWKEEIINNIDLEILSQLLESGTQDIQYLGQILQYSLGMLRKLSSSAKEDEMKKSHDKLLNELIEHSECNNRGPNSFVIAVIKGLRFTMEELKVLKAEVSRAVVDAFTGKTYRRRNRNQRSDAGIQPHLETAQAEQSPEKAKKNPS